MPDDAENLRFKYRHNYPYRRHPRPGDFGVRRSTPTTSTSTASTLKPIAAPGYQSSLGSKLGYMATEAPPGPFVTVAASQAQTENVTEARQPKVAKYNDDFSSGSGSNRHEVRVLPPDEFHHLLARVDGVDRKVKPPQHYFRTAQLNFSSQGRAGFSAGGVEKKTEKRKIQWSSWYCRQRFSNPGLYSDDKVSFFANFWFLLSQHYFFLVSHALEPTQVSMRTWKQTARYNSVLSS